MMEDVPEELPSQVPPPDIDASTLVLIVVGAHLRAEMADRPLAYQLRDYIEEWVGKHAAQLTVPIVPAVCTDVLHVNHESLQKRPTISLGGPGVNALSAFYAQRIEQAMVRDNQMVIQLDPEYVDLRACVWGMDHDLTSRALELFIEHYLDGFLKAVATQVEPEVE